MNWNAMEKNHLSNEVFVFWAISTHSDYLKGSLKQKKVMCLCSQQNKIFKEKSIKWSQADCNKNIM